METFIPGMEVRLASKEDFWQVRELAQLIFPGTYENIVRRCDSLYDGTCFIPRKPCESQFDSGQIILIIYFEGNACRICFLYKINNTRGFQTQ